MDGFCSGLRVRQFSGILDSGSTKEHYSYVLKKGEKIGHYQIDRLLGEGGMGEVYLARDTKLGRKVAIKLLLNAGLETNKSNLSRFLREAKAASALNHPNILVIHEVGETGGRHFIVSEFVEGQTLRSRLKHDQFSIREILDISMQVAAALAAAHAEKIVHRDIKPENIAVRPDGLVKVLDFGLAKLLEQKGLSSIGLEDETAQQNKTEQGVILGTINYLSPEQAKGEPVDERTDIFSLGILMYEMVTGRLPFSGDSLPETLSNLIRVDPPPLARFSADVPDDLNRVVSKLLRKDRDDRYQTMKGLLADLKEVRENLGFDKKPERSIPPSENETAIIQATTGNANNQTAKTQHSFFQRTKDHKALAGVAIAALLIGMIGFSYWYFGNRTNSPQVKSLAVLPLKSLDAGENYLGLGIADAVIRRINQTGELIVRPTSAVRRYLNEDTDALTAARQLNADAVLEGSVQRADDRLRVSVNLLRTSDGVSLWADSFDMRVTDIFTIQDTVSQQVASRLRLQLDPSQQARLTKPNTSNPVAYEFYLKGVYALDQRVAFDKATIETTIGFFKQAIEADPNFALAHAQLAFTYAMKAAFIEPTEPVWAERAKEEIDRAQALDPQLAETHIARFQLLFSAYEGYQGEAAVRELLLAQQINPNVGHAELSYLYSHIGLVDLAARELHRASEIDPTSEYVKNMTRLMYEAGSQYDEYAAHRELYRDDYMEAWYFIGKGRLDEAQSVIDEWSAKKPDDFDLPPKKALLLALKGDFHSAEAAIPSILSKHLVKDPIYHHHVYEIARLFALEGKNAEAVKWLREAAATGFPCYSLFERDAHLNRIRQAPEFIQFMVEMKAQNERYRSEFASSP